MHGRQCRDAIESAAGGRLRVSDEHATLLRGNGTTCHMRGAISTSSARRWHWQQFDRRTGFGTDGEVRGEAAA